MRRLLLLVVALIVYGTLFPWSFDFYRPLALHGFPNEIRRGVLRDIVLNVLLYAPLGVTAFLWLVRRHSRFLAVIGASVIGLALSTALELLQSYVPSRDPSRLDIVTNFTGALAGAVLALVFGPLIEEKLVRRRRSLDKPALFLAAAWATCQLYPFVPAITRSKLGESLRALLHSAPSADGIWSNAAEWFAFGLILRVLFPRSRVVWLALSMGALGARVFVMTRSVTVNEIAGAALALVLWAIVPERMRLTAGAWFLGIALLLRELAPFHFVAQSTPFEWVPFGPTLAAEPTSAVVILARKVFDYGTMVWLLHERGLRYVRSAIAVAIPLFVCEWLQRHMPGRTPEITDPVLAILLAALLTMLSRLR